MSKAPLLDEAVAAKISEQITFTQHSFPGGLPDCHMGTPCRFYVVLQAGLLGPDTRRATNSQAEILRDPAHTNYRDGEEGNQLKGHRGLLRNIGRDDRTELLRETGTRSG